MEPTSEVTTKRYKWNKNEGKVLEKSAKIRQRSLKPSMTLTKSKVLDKYGTDDNFGAGVAAKRS